MGLRAMFRPGMRAYAVPLVAGAVLAASAFLPWVVVGDISLRGFPDTMALWILGLGLAAALLATLSLITRKNSRHPIFLVGLVALGIMFLSWRIMPRNVGQRALTRWQAIAIVEDRPIGEAPVARAGSGIYLGLIASVALVGFGLTIVVRRASDAYVLTTTDDDA
jgi:hypothetical protein